MRRHNQIGTAVDFCGNPALDVVTGPGHHSAELQLTIPPTVCLQAGDGPVRFQFSMTADGARALADLLVIAAAEIDKIAEASR